MCGIAGFSGDFDPVLLQRMGRRLAHRGPDDSGTYLSTDGKVGLAHRRLSIIDLSPSGHQPMSEASDIAVVVYNGEIFNFQELRRELQLEGFSFRSRSDTEVLLNLYLRDGERMLRKLNGMFAFALLDIRDGSLFLARDGL